MDSPCDGKYTIIFALSMWYMWYYSITAARCVLTAGKTMRSRRKKNPAFPRRGLVKEIPQGNWNGLVKCGEILWTCSQDFPSSYLGHLRQPALPWIPTDSWVVHHAKILHEWFGRWWFQGKAKEYLPGSSSFLAHWNCHWMSLKWQVSPWLSISKTARFTIFPI